MAHETHDAAPETHDAFALLLEEIDHEDLARSMRLERARTAAPATAPAAPASPPPPMAAGGEHYHLLSSAQAAAFTPPAELYMDIGAFGTAQWQQQLQLQAQAPPPVAYPTQQIGSPLLNETLTAELAAPSASDESASTLVPANGAARVQSPVPECGDSTSRYNSTDDEKSSPLPLPPQQQQQPQPPPQQQPQPLPQQQQQTQTETQAETQTQAETETQTETQTQPRKPMENSTRKRQKEELAYLRQKVLELETELRVMKDRARATALSRQHDGGNESDDADATSTSASESPAPSSNGSAPLLPPSSSSGSSHSAAPAPESRVAKVSLWERVAKRQLLEKQKAEMKNLKLKTALEDQLKIAKSLEKVLRKRPSATLSTQVLDSVHVVNSKRFCTLSPSDASIYDMLLANTDKVYAEVDDVHARNEYLQLEDDINDTKVKVDESNQLYMEITHAKTIPFDLQTTVDGVWQVLSLAQVPIADGVYEAVERTHDTICAMTTMSLYVRNTETKVRTRFVMKRFDEPNRVILACESSTHSEGPREVVHGIKVLEKGWIVVKPASVKRKDGGASTIIQLCMRMTPTITGDVLETQRRHTGAITDMILGAVNKSLGVMYQTVENILMEKVAQPPPTTVP